ncbi:hypothetical protein D5S10_21150 [Pseudomonas savastanoi]|nr:hypothetical protein D5S10_21150 [Pseudomonas savastanoi]
MRRRACGTRIQLSCDALRRMPFRTLRVLLTTQSVETCIPTLERGNDDRNYRATLRAEGASATQPNIFLKNTCMSDQERSSAALS